MKPLEAALIGGTVIAGALILSGKKVDVPQAAQGGFNITMPSITMPDFSGLFSGVSIGAAGEPAGGGFNFQNPFAGTTAEELVSEGKKKAEKLVSEGKKGIEELVSEGKKKVEELVSEGEEKVENLISQGKANAQFTAAEIADRATSVISGDKTPAPSSMYGTIVSAQKSGEQALTLAYRMPSSEFDLPYVGLGGIRKGFLVTGAQIAQSFAFPLGRGVFGVGEGISGVAGKIGDFFGRVGGLV